MSNNRSENYEVRQPIDDVTGLCETVAVFEWEQDARNYVQAVNNGTIPYEHESFADFNLIAVSLWTNEVIAW